jgi:hypothetical protein
MWATGGGWSTLFAQPSWQAGPGVLNNGQRGNPDVAWDADPQTGVVVPVFNNANGFYYFYVLGGTSVGSPCWAGAMALIDQKAGSPLGFINPAIYSILNNPAEYSKAFHDVTVGNNNPYSATKGWGPLTGIGSPNLGELADYLAPTGQLPVVVTNDLSDAPGKAYAYGKTVHLTAVVAHNKTISGPVTATIASSTGAVIASNIAMTYKASAGAWLGSYVIKLTDPPGEWSVTVTAANSSSIGEGYTSFAVGDGVSIMNPPYITGITYYNIGDTIHVDSYVVDTSGNNVTKGTYAATFYLAQNQTTGNGLGKIEGNATLHYNSLDKLWEVNFWIGTLSSADQGAWIMVVNGTDLAGNKGSAYTWINVGLYVYAFTDSPTYVLGDKISIHAQPYYLTNGNPSIEVETGTFTAKVYDGAIFVANVPLTYNNSMWNGELATSVEDPAGFYTITVNGTDGYGSCGSFATVVRMAQYRLSVQASLSNPVVLVQNGNESWVLAKVAYPDGNPMTVGQVMGYVYRNATTRINWFPMTYNLGAGGFVAVNVFHAVNATVTPVGNYTVDVDAYDALGNYGNTTASFTVSAFGVHDVAVTSLTPYRTIQSQGYGDSISVTVANQGSYIETFNVTADANTTAIATQTVTLTSGSFVTITLTWNTAGLAYGNYTISANVALAPGETNLWIGPLTYGTVKVTIPGDINGDGVVNLLDLGVITGNWMQTVPPAPANADFLDVGVINLFDLGVVTAHWMMQA